MKQRIFRSIVIIALLTCIVCAFIFSYLFYVNSQKRMEFELQTNFSYIKLGYELKGIDFLKELEDKHSLSLSQNKEIFSNRITLVEHDGTVIYDNFAIVSQMDNHHNRPEVMDALLRGFGEDERKSSTLSYNNYYYAESFPDGKVLRISDRLDSFLYSFLMIIPQIFLVMVIIVLIILFFSQFVTKKILRPFSHVSFVASKIESPYDEIAPFINEINEQRSVINQQINSLTRHEAEFKIIFENMTEGLMLVDNFGQIKVKSLVCDRFLRLMELIKDDGTLAIEKPHEAIKALLETLKKGVNTSVVIEKNEKFLNVLCHPIILGGMNSEGAIVVIIDVTEQANREQLRREFSANVSHELKTPLTSISGFAEIIRNGIAKEQDIKHFADNIYNEAQRLLSLIADIIHLSTLDESTQMTLEREEINFKKLTQHIMNYLTNSISHKYIEVYYDKVEDDVCAQCVPRIMEEALYNLCDNAIKYNRINGKINFNIYHKDPKHIVWQISDTGIGIPYEAQDRIFERFFRVDKSHSRSIGGTGLGLSIVKHAITLHGGIIEVNSIEGQGTTFTVTLPVAGK